MLKQSQLIGEFARELKAVYTQLFNYQLTRYAYIVASASLGEDCTFARHCRSLAEEAGDLGQIRQQLTNLGSKLQTLLDTLEKVENKDG